MKAKLDNGNVTPTEKEAARTTFINARKEYRKCLRQYQTSCSLLRDQKLNTILSKNPKDAFKALRFHKENSEVKLKFNLILMS